MRKVHTISCIHTKSACEFGSYGLNRTPKMGSKSDFFLFFVLFVIFHKAISFYSIEEFISVLGDFIIFCGF